MSGPSLKVRVIEVKLHGHRRKNGTLHQVADVTISEGFHVYALYFSHPFVMAALCNGGDYIFARGFYLLLSLFSLPNLSSHRLDVYHTSAHGVALVRI